MEFTQNTLPQKSLKELQRTLQTTMISFETDRDDYVSVYRPGRLTIDVLLQQTEKILICFPKLERQFINLLRERFKANNFSDERMTDAVNHVIDNYTGYDKLPAIADFIKFDRKVRIYTHQEVTEKNLWGSVIAIKIGLPQPRWIKSEDFGKGFFKKWQ